MGTVYVFFADGFEGPLEVATDRILTAIKDNI